MSRPLRYPLVFSFRLNEEAAQRLATCAETHAMRPAEFARALLLDAIASSMRAPPVRRRVLHGEILRGIAGELGRQGGLLNQIATKLNSGSMTSGVAALEELCAGHLATLEALADALGGGHQP